MSAEFGQPAFSKPVGRQTDAVDLFAHLADQSRPSTGPYPAADGWWTSCDRCSVTYSVDGSDGMQPVDPDTLDHEALSCLYCGALLKNWQSKP